MDGVARCISEDGWGDQPTESRSDCMGQGVTMTYTHSEFRFKLADGRDVYWNRVSGFSVEHDHQYLVCPTEKEALEIAQITSDDDAAHSEECERERVALLHMDTLELDDMSDTLTSENKQQTEMW